MVTPAPPADDGAVGLIWPNAAVAPERPARDVLVGSGISDCGMFTQAVCCKPGFAS
jgi:hypothetical protein